MSQLVPKGGKRRKKKEKGGRAELEESLLVELWEGWGRWEWYSVTALEKAISLPSSEQSTQKPDMSKAPARKLPVAEG